MAGSEPASRVQTREQVSPPRRFLQVYRLPGAGGGDLGRQVVDGRGWVALLSLHQLVENCWNSWEHKREGALILTGSYGILLDDLPDEALVPVGQALRELWTRAVERQDLCPPITPAEFPAITLGGIFVPLETFMQIVHGGEAVVRAATEPPAGTPAGHPSPKEADALSDRDSGGTAGVDPMKTGSARGQRASKLGTLMSSRIDAASQEVAASRGQETAALFRHLMQRVMIETLGDYLNGETEPVARHRPGLAPSERELFDKLDRIEGRGAAARRQCGKLLVEYLGGKPISEALTDCLREYLKSREWGLRCKCGAAAGILWHKDDRLVTNRGAMVYSHLDEHGKHAKHISLTEFPREERDVTVVERPDRRRRRTAS